MGGVVGAGHAAPGQSGQAGGGAQGLPEEAHLGGHHREVPYYRAPPDLKAPTY